MDVKKRLLPIVAVISILIGAGGMYVGLHLFGSETATSVLEQNSGGFLSNDSGNQSEMTEEEFEKFKAAYEVILESYYEEVDREELIEGAISGMLEALDDPYSVYMNEEIANEFMESLDDSFEGIGAEVSMVNGKVTIVSPFRDSPADKAGLRPNDQIIKIDGEDIEGLSLHEAVSKIRGEKGTTVVLTIQRPGVNEPLEIPVVRDEIPLETVHGDIIEKNGKRIGIIDITSFSVNTAERFKEELKNLEMAGIEGLIIDVRDNPGGFLQSVEEIGNLIIPGGEPVVQIEDRERNTFRHLSTLKGKKDYPIVGLINEGSASASEILAAALKEAGGYDLVGKNTYGKGTVQQTKSMGDGSEIKITIYKWLTSDGNFINEVGVEPTVEVDQPDFFYVSPINLSEGEELSFDMTNPQIISAQKMLEGLGYSPGRTDGYFSKETEKAVKEFQKDHDLTVSGKIDEETANHLHQEILNAIRDKKFDNQLEKAIELLTK